MDRHTANVIKQLAALALCVMLLAPARAAPASASLYMAATGSGALPEGVYALSKAYTLSVATTASKGIPKPNPADPPATTPVIQITGGALEVRYYSESKARFKLRVAVQGSTKFTNYDFYANNAAQRFALPAEAAAYTVQVCENISGTKYRIVHEQTVSFQGAQASQSQTASPAQTQAPSQAPNPNSPYLASVSDIDWLSAVVSVEKARELCNSKAGSRDKAEAVYNYLVARLSYDFSKLGKLPSSYLPVMDDTYITQMGICYDIASLYAGMLRSSGVPTKLCMGYTSMVEGYHAWNEVELSDGRWHTVDITTDCQLRGYGKSVSFAKPQGTFSATKSY